MERKFTTFFVVVIMVVCLFPSLALAENDTEIRTSVPAEYTIRINCGNDGSIQVRGAKQVHADLYVAERFSDVVITVTPNRGYEIQHIDVDYTGDFVMESHQIMLNRIWDNSVVSISFCPIQNFSDTPKTGDSTNIILLGCLMLISLFILGILFIKKKCG